MIANWFGYTSDTSFNSSSAKERILKGIKHVIEHIEQYNRKE